MTAPATPAAILLATDLSSRSDRAQARALQLARQWQARLVVLVALEDEAEFGLPNTHRDPDAKDDAPPETPAERIAAHARRELADAGVPVEVRVVVGKPGPTAAKVAQETGCALIVTGTSRSDVAMRLSPGSTLRWLARQSPVAVLAVNDRTRGAYAHVVVASDYSPAAAAALQLAQGWFGNAPDRSLLHGYDIPLAVLSLNDEPRAGAMATLQDNEQRQAGEHLAATLGDAAAGWTPRVHVGGPVRLLRELAHAGGTELTVIASHGRNALVDRLIGSVADRLLETVGNDLLVVRAPRT